MGANLLVFVLLVLFVAVWFSARAKAQKQEAEEVLENSFRSPEISKQKEELIDFIRSKELNGLNLSLLDTRDQFWKFNQLRIDDEDWKYKIYYLNSQLDTDNIEIFDNFEEAGKAFLRSLDLLSNEI